MKQHGEFTIFSPDAPKPFQNGTHQCCHCGAHFQIERGSGKLRGFCMRCNGHFCGPQCEACIPEEKLLELMESGVDVDRLDPSSLPVSVFLPKDIPDS